MSKLTGYKINKIHKNFFWGGLREVMGKFVDSMKKLWNSVRKRWKKVAIGLLTSTFLLDIIGGQVGNYIPDPRRVFGKVEVINQGFSNVPKYVNGNEIKQEDTDILKNYIQTNVSIENGRFGTTVHKIKLDDVKVEPYQYVDLVIQNGFNNDTETVNFYIFNNGTKESSRQKFEVEIIYKNLKSGENQTLENKTIEVESLRGGDISSIFELSLSKSYIKKYMDEKLSDVSQVIEINLQSRDLNSKIEIPYYTSLKKFMEPARGGIGVLFVDKPVVPLVKLTDPHKQEYTFTVDQPLIEDRNNFKINFLVDRAMSLTYRVNFLDDKGEIIVSSEQKDSVKIRFPKYKLLTGFQKEIYKYMVSNRLNHSTVEEVRYREPHLLNSVEKTKQEYNLD